MRQFTEPDDNPPFTYAGSIADSMLLLEDICEELQLIAFNICVINELKDYKELFEDGDDIPFDPAVLAVSDEPSVKEVVALISLIDKSRETLYNINPDAAKLADDPDRVLNVFFHEPRPPEEKTVSDWAETLQYYRWETSYLVNVQVCRMARETNEFCDDWDEEELAEMAKRDGNAAVLMEVSSGLMGQEEDG